MTGMTGDEVLAFIQSNEWSTGLKVNEDSEKKLRFDDADANAIYVGPPENTGRAAYFARVISLLGAEDDSMFYGALLWITLYGIGSPQIEQTGFVMLEAMRRGSGENRPLGAAEGNWFRFGTHVELAGYILLCLNFGWDAWLVPSNGDLFVYLCHDDYCLVVTRNDATYKACWDALKHCDPEQASPHQLKTFCPNSTFIEG